MNNYIFKTLVFILFVSVQIGLEPLYAQQDSQFTQYMYNTVTVNPAYAGTRGSLSMVGVYRNQWVGLSGAPETVNFSVNSPIGVQGVGLGLGFTSDKLGPSMESLITADFSYTIQVAEELNLSFGIKGGISLFSLDPNKLNIYNPNDYDLTRENSASPVVGGGLYLHSNRWYLGLSSPNFLETDHYDDIKVSTATEKSHIYFIGGYVFDLSNSIKLKPAVLVKAVSGAPLAIDISANALINNSFTLGLAYRLDAAVSAMAGFQINENIMVGYAYDYETTDLGSYNNGSHEIFLRFELGTRLKGKVNPRFF
ncbi:type IX secretion system PorP/SprF family membrane protein [Oceanihabitans sediminis]|uniref:Type IX secretion system membrane protein PorP/SprF n=1 Tax=Oceanihabitans sediminis TaxID=1812012 RepID=A0A368P253_9FLAO|nr:type IX secretion system membrane protein PorP/SprF [Oceanihabitans sediminis]RBP30980.1 type IX secretion system PorP/SprF family membrane protein [Oceanihabitans sediminis]RCU56932.1 type IX secretion system membrane protein PorP/SprF [Oceanihabitans sediminis]